MTECIPIVVNEKTEDKWTNHSHFNAKFYSTTCMHLQNQTLYTPDWLSNILCHQKMLNKQHLAFQSRYVSASNFS